MKKELLLVALLFSLSSVYSQNLQQQKKTNTLPSHQSNFTLSGIIRDTHGGDNLIGATVYVPELKTGVVCNRYGFYSITLPAGTYKIQFSFIGYTAIERRVDLTSDIKQDIELAQTVTAVGEVIIKGMQSEENLRSSVPGMARLNTIEIKGIPTFGGQPDVMKSLQMLPGVLPVNDGLSQYSVRGGSFDQNLILLDEAPVYNPSHVLGFFSAFNTDAVQSVEILKGFIPARFGGRLSSVADIRMREGNHHNFKAAGNINPSAISLTLETPLKNDKSSLLISGRYFSFKPVSYIIEGLYSIFYIPGLNNFARDNKIHFYDFNFKYNHRLDAKNQFFLSGYTGNDGFYFAQIDDRGRQEWGNTTATFRWNHIAGDKLFFNASAIYSRYNYAFSIRDGAENYKWSAFINQANGKIDVDYYPGLNHHIEFGASLNFIDIMPGSLTPTDTLSLISDYRMNARRSFETALYVSNEQRSGRFAFNYGLRIVPYFYIYNQPANNTNEKAGNNDNYLILEPRMSARYMISDQMSVKIAYTRSSQSLHLLSNSAAGMPTDIWMPADRFIRPQTSDQFSAGGYSNLLNGKLEVSLEGFYKKMDHIIDFRDAAAIRLNEDIQNEILTGIGEAYGLEFLLRKPSGKLTGWLGYTLSKTERKIDGINNNRFYPARYDQRHNISLFLSQLLGKRLTLSTTFTYHTGQAVTMPIGTFSIKGDLFTYYSGRNGFRLPGNHRLDLAVTFKSRIKEDKRWRSEWTASVYNVYGRRNVFSYYFDYSGYQDGEIDYHVVFLPGTIPMVTYNFFF